jgi:hypothetical protein
MTKIYCRGCEMQIGAVPSDPPSQEDVKALRERLGGKCPNCGRELWAESKRLPSQEPKAISLRYLID